jgi:hypothetical protein
MVMTWEEEKIIKRRQSGGDGKEDGRVGASVISSKKTPKRTEKAKKISRKTVNRRVTLIYFAKKQYWKYCPLKQKKLSEVMEKQRQNK